MALNAKRKSVAICVAGWHYNRDFYAQVSCISEAEVFVVSHKVRDSVPRYLFDYVTATNVFLNRMLVMIGDVINNLFQRGFGQSLSMLSSCMTTLSSRIGGSWYRVSHCSRNTV